MNIAIIIIIILLFISSISNICSTFSLLHIWIMILHFNISFLRALWSFSFSTVLVLRNNVYFARGRSRKILNVGAVATFGVFVNAGATSRICNGRFFVGASWCRVSRYMTSWCNCQSSDWSMRFLRLARRCKEATWTLLGWRFLFFNVLDIFVVNLLFISISAATTIWFRLSLLGWLLCHSFF